jgi:hypothetical protein
VQTAQSPTCSAPIEDVAIIVDEETGEEGLLIEPEGQYIIKTSPLGPLDPDFRLFSQTRFGKMGLKLRQHDDDTDWLHCV